MTPFDPPTPHFSPDAFPPALRAVSLVLALAVIGIIFFQAAATGAFVA